MYKWINLYILNLCIFHKCINFWLNNCKYFFLFFFYTFYIFTQNLLQIFENRNCIIFNDIAIGRYWKWHQAKWHTVSWSIYYKLTKSMINWPGQNIVLSKIECRIQFHYCQIIIPECLLPDKKEIQDDK